jgi:isoleucyl-tRNA synthetase
LARFPSEAGSVHLEQFVAVPVSWRDPALGERWARIRALRGQATTALENARNEKLIGASLQAALQLPPDYLDMLDPETWAEVAIVSRAEPGAALRVFRAPGEKCARCWRVLEAVGTISAHRQLCIRCDEVVSKLPADRVAAE